MEIDDCTTRPRDGEGVSGEAFTVATVGENAVTQDAPAKPAYSFDHSRYDIREIVIDGMTIRVFRRPKPYGDRRRGLWCEVLWREQLIGIEVMPQDATEADADAAALRLADDLRNVVATVSRVIVDDAWGRLHAAVGDLGKGLPTLGCRIAGTEPAWLAVPDQIVEPKR